MTIDTVEHVPVVIAGAGPVGLTLPLELEHHGVDALLVGRNTTTTRHPKMDITNGRSMSFFTGWGSLTAYGSWRSPPTTRFTYPSVDESDAQTRARNDGTLPLEPSMRVSQILLDPRPRLGSLLAGLKGFQATAP
jgi:2-polyprenyl-6-methoxyphenol hydroxylase-like FAD-dependent oxidoreductase